MKRLPLMLFIIFGLLLFGCATDKEVTAQIRQKSVEQGKIFTEVTDALPMPGFSVLVIRAIMKTVKEGFYPFESRTSLHGKPLYPFVFNIGGQGVIWMAKGRPDTQQRIVGRQRNPEGGEGIKYTLEKEVALRPGTYTVYLGLTEEELQKEVVITLKKGETSILDFRPLYFPGRHNRNTGSFYEGVKSFEVFFDSKKISSLPNRS
jgi:hypothetical protein